MKTSNQKKIRGISLFVISSLVFISLTVNITYILHPLKIKKILSKIYKVSRTQTLSRLDGHLISQEIEVRVLKIKTGNKIQLEFLSKEEDETFSVINTLELQGSREAYYSYGRRGKTLTPSSLGFSDVDGDGVLDILAPSFNNFFHPYLNVASYNKKTKKFELKKTSRPKIVPRS